MADTPAVLHRWDDVPSERISDSLTRRLVTGERMMLARLHLDEGAFVPMHSHENEQLSWVLEGALRFVVEEGRSGEATREIVVRAGEVLHLPSHLPHSAEAIEDTVAVDIFSPPRQEWLETKVEADG